jgi:hypothetical protein
MLAVSEFGHGVARGGLLSHTDYKPPRTQVLPR